MDSSLPPDLVSGRIAIVARTRVCTSLCPVHLIRARAGTAYFVTGAQFRQSNSIDAKT